MKRILVGLITTVAALAQGYSTNGDERLAGYIEQALERNPAVRRSFAQYRAALQRMPQVSALPDPVLGVRQYARTPETRVGPQTTMFSLTQRFPWFGKLSDKEKIAAKQAAGVAQAHEAVKAETVRQVKLAYYDLAYIASAVDTTQEDLGRLRHYETLAAARYAQGIGLQQGVVKLQAEITRDLTRLETLRRQRTDAEAVLNLAMDRRVGTQFPRIDPPVVPDGVR